MSQRPLRNGRVYKSLYFHDNSDSDSEEPLQEIAKKTPVVSTSSSPAEKKAEKQKEKRFEYLLKHSEQLAQFMTTGSSEEKKTVKKGKLGKKSQDHRHSRSSGNDDEEVGEPRAVYRFEKTPFYIAGGEMRDYQVRGLNWLISLYENNINGVLADEMGLGKTLQTIAILGYMQNVKKCDLPHLIIVPLTTLTNWENEFHRWCPSIVVAVMKGNQDKRNALIKETKKKRTWDVIVTSYELVLREQAFLRKHQWGYLVIDEAHRIKNEETKLAVAVRTLKSSRRLLLTGTPLQNSLHELWALLNFLLPDIFESSEDFDSWFDDSACLNDMGLIERLHAILRPFLLRRVKADVERDLPTKTEIKLFVGLTPMQRTWYRNILLKDISVLDSVRGIGSSGLHNLLMHLRKCCNHPYLFKDAEPGPPYEMGQHLVDNSGKMILLHKLLPRLKSEGSKVLIFSQMTRVLDILEDYCEWMEYEYCRFDGQTSQEDRQKEMLDFCAPDSDKFIFLLTTRSGGLGINLTAANTVILYDSDWNPHADLQAMDRVHRIGQMRPVTIYRLINENTVDEHIVIRAEKKLRLDAMVIQSGRLVDAGKGLKKEEILAIIRRGAYSIIHSDAEKITDEDIDTILEKGKAKTNEINKSLGALTEDNLRGLNNDLSQPCTYLNFEGEDWRPKQLEAKLQEELKDLERGWMPLGKRKRRQLYDLSGTRSGPNRENSPEADSWSDQGEKASSDEDEFDLKTLAKKVPGVPGTTKKIKLELAKKAPTLPGTTSYPQIQYPSTFSSSSQPVQKLPCQLVKVPTNAAPGVPPTFTYDLVAVLPQSTALPKFQKPMGVPKSGFSAKDDLKLIKFTALRDGPLGNFGYDFWLDLHKVHPEIAARNGIEQIRTRMQVIQTLVHLFQIPQAWKDKLTGKKITVKTPEPSCSHVHMTMPGPLPVGPSTSAAEFFWKATDTGVESWWPSNPYMHRTTTSHKSPLPVVTSSKSETSGSQDLAAKAKPKTSSSHDRLGKIKPETSDFREHVTEIEKQRKILIDKAAQREKVTLPPTDVKSDSTETSNKKPVPENTVPDIPDVSIRTVRDSHSPEIEFRPSKFIRTKEKDAHRPT